MDNTTTSINIPFPDDAELHLVVRIGACRLVVMPGTRADAWVAGSYSESSGALPLKITQEAGDVRITQDPIPSEFWNMWNNPPRLTLRLGTARPYRLTLEGGASESEFDLGGLPLHELNIRQGAGKMDFDFSVPNPQPMTHLDVEAGAVGMEMVNLVNANFAEMKLQGGAASFYLDFNGQLRRDARVEITTGVSAVTVVVPSATAARILPETVMAGLDVGDHFTRLEGTFNNPAASSGGTPALTIRASVTLGSLKLRTA